MKQQINIEEVPLRNINSSYKYKTGKRFPTNSCGDITILGQIDIPEVKSDGTLMYRQFLVQFDDGFYTIAFMSNINKGKVKNPYYPSIFNKGYIGVGKWKTTLYTHKIKKETQEYITWKGMLERCYGPQQQKRTPSYKGVYVDQHWFNFQNFCEDIQFLKGYTEWKEHRGEYQLDKDILSGDTKIYSKNTCQFITNKENKSEASKRSNKTGKMYSFKRLSDNYVYVTDSQIKFANLTNLHPASVCLLIKGTIKTCKGWTVHVDEHVIPEMLSPDNIIKLDNIYEKFYIAERLYDGYKEKFTVQRAFSKKYNLNYKNVNKCLKGQAKTHKGWTFKEYEEGEIIGKDK